MAKKAKQQEMDGIDNTVLAAALTKAADLADEIREIEEKRAVELTIIHREMNNHGKDKLEAHGFRYRVKTTQAKHKLEVKRLTI